MRKLPLRQFRLFIRFLAVIAVITLWLRLALGPPTVLKPSNITEDSIIKPNTTVPAPEQILHQVLPLPPSSKKALITDSVNTVSKITMFDNTLPNTINPYKVCNMENVCQQDGETVFFTLNEAMTRRLNHTYIHCCLHPNTTECNVQNKFDTLFCGCFSPESKLRFETIASADAVKFEPQPTWMISQWLQTKRHHIAHFSYSVIQFHSIQLHKKELRLPDQFETIVFQDGSDTFNVFEQDMWDIIAHGANVSQLLDFRFLRRSKKDPNYEKLMNTPMPRYCFRNVHSTIRGDIYATSPEDLDAFKRAASEVLGIDTGSNQSSPCPPRKAAIVIRQSGMGLRKITNLDKVIKVLKKATNLPQIDIVAPSEKHSLREQAEMFSSYGLVISSHSSQLANMIFAHTNSVVIEVGPIYKRAFRHLGEMSRLKYINSFRHRPVNVPVGISKQFDGLLKTCDFERMMHEMHFRCNLTAEEHVLLSRADFVVHLKRFRDAVEEGLMHLNSVCSSSGGWVRK